MCTWYCICIAISCFPWTSAAVPDCTTFETKWSNLSKQHSSLYGRMQFHFLLSTCPKNQPMGELYCSNKRIPSFSKSSSLPIGRRKHRSGSSAPHSRAEQKLSPYSTMVLQPSQQVLTYHFSGGADVTPRSGTTACIPTGIQPWVVLSDKVTGTPSKSF